MEMLGMHELLEKKAAGLGMAQSPPSANKFIRKNLLCWLFTARTDWLVKQMGAMGACRTPIREQHDPQNRPLLQTQ